MAKKKSEWVDPEDAPNLTAEWFATAEITEGSKVVRPGRPPLAHPKELVSLRLDQDVVARLRELGAGWQTKANAALRDFVDKVVPK